MALLGGGLHPEAGWLRLPLIGLPFARRGSGVKSGGSHPVGTPQALLTLEGRVNTMQATTQQGHAAEGRGLLLLPEVLPGGLPCHAC
jgi:hypothetical protein